MGGLHDAQSNDQVSLFLEICHCNALDLNVAIKLKS